MRKREDQHGDRQRDQEEGVQWGGEKGACERVWNSAKDHQGAVWIQNVGGSQVVEIMTWGFGWVVVERKGRLNDIYTPLPTPR